jgi:putative copper export protein
VDELAPAGKKDMMILQEPISWSEAAVELIGFVGTFLAAGAIGFRYSVLRHRLAPPAAPLSEERQMHEAAAAKAAMLGFIGALIAIVLLFGNLPQQAARQHVGIPQLITHSGTVMAQVTLAVLAIAGFVLAWVRVNAGWPLAAVGVVAGALRAAFFGQWLRVINPVHRLAAGFWIGTLFVLVVAGLGTVARSRLSSSDRGRAAADMVNAFSPLALVSFAALAIFGVITAWRHLGALHALWTTPYGYALIAKLVVVAFVIAFGAFNWRRQKPLLGTEEASAVLRRSATAELAVASIVLVITAILVSLPAPSESRPQPKRAPAATAPSTQ